MEKFEKINDSVSPNFHLDGLYYNLIKVMIDEVTSSPRLEMWREQILEKGWKTWPDLARGFLHQGTPEPLRMAFAYATFPQIEILNTPFTLENAAKSIELAYLLGRLLHQMRL